MANLNKSPFCICGRPKEDKNHIDISEDFFPHNPKISIDDTLKEYFPSARPGFIEALLQALAIHSKKNHDYNGKVVPIVFNDFETKSKFSDIRRKYSRLFHMVAEEQEMQVDEKLEDTVLDLVVYSALFLEYIKEYENTSRN